MIDEKNMRKSTAKLINVNRDGTSITYEYECPCKEGKIIDYEVPGWVDDWYAEIKCPNCQNKYNVVTGCGEIWQLVLKK